MHPLQIETTPGREEWRGQSGPLLGLDADAFRENFNRRPFLITHQLCGHPLFSLDRLMELARTLPPDHVEYNAGQLPISLDGSLTPRNGLSPEETLRRIEDCQSWMVLKYVDNDPLYRDLLNRCLAEVQVHSEAICPGLCQPQAFIFLTSPGSITPYHMDPEHNFLLQIRGGKTIHLFDGHDRDIVSDEELEQFYLGVHRNMVFREAYRAKSTVHELGAGQGLHFPVTFPHYVQNGPAVSISFSITFRTPDLERRSLLYQGNAGLRRKGWRPAPVGKYPWRDRFKVQWFRLLRKTRKLLGKPIA